MGNSMKNRDLWFLLICFALGLLAEMSFFHGRIGISYPVFLIGFYTVVFMRFKYSFHHRRIGLLMMVCVWILSANYLFYDIHFFQGMNMLFIPAFVFTHLILITSPIPLKWGKPRFIITLFEKLVEAYIYIFSFIRDRIKNVFLKSERKTVGIVARILLGFVIAVPLLVIVIVLLMSADMMFENFIGQLPNFLSQISISTVFRIAFIVFIGLLFYGVFQVLGRKGEYPQASLGGKFSFSSISAVTILVLLNLVYIVFVSFQFTYFFNGMSGKIIEGYTYAKYARQGFFELVLVLLINWTVLISFLKFVHTEKRTLRIGLQSLYSLLIGMSGIILVSAFMRLTLYEEAYGFTLARVLAHVFMIYLLVIFAYTLIRIWLVKLPLLHFYVIVGIIFYTGINAVNVDQFIVNKNLERYEETGKIDLEYLRDLSAAGTLSLIELYERDPEIEDLEAIIISEKKYIEYIKEDSWQSYNFTREKLKKSLLEFEVRRDEQ